LTAESLNLGTNKLNDAYKNKKLYTVADLEMQVDKNSITEKIQTCLRLWNNWKL
jgi:hypothetical protein